MLDKLIRMQQRESSFDRVRKIFREGEKLYGCTDIEAVMATIGTEFGFARQAALVTACRGINRSAYLYPGSIDTIKGLLSQGDRVKIWTQGHPENQQHKVNGTGIQEEIAATRFMDRFSLYIHPKKIPVLHEPAEEEFQKGVQQIVVVDDKAENMLNLKTKVQEMRNQGQIPQGRDINLVWSRQGPYRDRVPPGVTVEDVKHGIETIDDIQELLAMRAVLNRNVGWLMDLDHTLLKTGESDEIMYRLAAQMVDQHLGISVPQRV